MMNIYIQDKVLEFSNDSKTIEQIFNIINEYLQEEDIYFSHLNIDGENIYNNLYDYFIDNIRSIKHVEVVSMPLAEMVNESIISADQYARNSIPIIKSLAEEFYQKPNENTWSQLTDLFEGIQWIIQSLTQINSIESSNDIASDYSIWEEYVQEVSKLNDIIPELDNSIVSQDYILIGDILLYEIIPVFEAMVEKLSLLISEVVDKDVN